MATRSLKKEAEGMGRRKAHRPIAAPVKARARQA
jgi:hypothetical protein